MTPALPGEAPDPSATPRLDAILKEVELPLVLMPDSGSDFGVLVAERANAVRLASMLRVAVEALERLNDPYGDAFPINIAGNALVEMERIAAGDQGGA